ncbi:MAG TPA: hypothetical protein VN841_30195 [Bryobacteraceae bacterium]|nr:hypothetical protein [Bryobacteraceae bacterium]
MTKHPILKWAALFFICAFFSIAGSAQERPAKRNPAYNPAAASLFDSFNTGVVLKIKSASIAKDGTITARFTLTDSAGAGLDINGVLPRARQASA